jgi:RNA polymerase sigma-70 factor, ECF subfamily
LPERSQQITLRSLGDDRVRALAGRYADAIEAGRTDVLVKMLTADAAWAMPPLRTWYHRTGAITGFLENHVFGERWRHVTTVANGQLAVGCYTVDPELGRFVPSVIDVLTLDGDRIARVDGFLTTEMLGRLGYEGTIVGTEQFPRFGMPADLN